MMEKTYSQAKNVLVWLGKATDSTRTAISFMNKIISSSVSVVDLVKGHSNEWIALENLMRLPWFTRRWIVQEIALGESSCWPFISLGLH
jgi:hypothetical protein